jgi:hypothetical protein
VWIGGNGGGDGMVLKFTQDGKFLMMVGKKGVPIDSNSQEHFGMVAKISIDAKENEAYISDGYGNKRVVVIDADTGKFKRYWGAYGNKPDDTNLGRYNPEAPPAQQFRTPVHCAEMSKDRLVYVCDRVNDRIQVFHARGQVREGSVGRRRTRWATARRGTSRSRTIRSRSSSTSPTATTRKSGSSIASRSRSSPASATAARCPASSTPCTASPPTRRATSTRPRPTTAAGCSGSSTRGCRR